MLVKGSLIFDIIKQAQVTLKTTSLMGFSYETQDCHPRIWIENMPDAIALRNYVNSIVGWPICAKPKLCDANDDYNPFTQNVIVITLLQKEFALQTERFDGDASKTLIAQMMEAGIVVK